MWATTYIERLKAGETVTFRPRGNSMTPHIASGQQVTVRPLREGEPRKGDIVLVSMSARVHYLHFVRAREGDRVQIANARGRVNGWAHLDRVHGIVSAVAS